MAPYFVKSKRGGNILVHEGFMYHKRYDRNGKTYWSCVNKLECNGTAITNDSTLEVVSRKEHNHPPSRKRATSIEVLNQMKRQAAEHPEMASSQIIEKELETLSTDVLMYLPERATIRRALSRQRQAKLRDSPKCLTELKDLPQELVTLPTSENFLLYDNYHEKAPRILIYATRTNLFKLGGSKTWFLSGSYKVNPQTSTYLFTIHGTFNNHVLPLVYALLERKSEEAYTAILYHIKRRSKEMEVDVPDPDTIITDAEKNVMKAQQRVFPNAKVRLCFVYFRQCIINAIRDKGLQSEYMNPDKQDLQMGIYQMISLAFVPPEEVPDCFDLLLDYLPDEVLDLAEYVEQTFIRGRNARNKKHVIPPKHPPELWNQFEAAKNGETEYNSLMEEWHNRFQRVIGKHHPSLFHLIREIFKEQCNTENVTVKSEGKKYWKKSQKLKHRRIMQHLKKMSSYYEEHLENNRIIEYLQSCGYIFTL